MSIARAVSTVTALCLFAQPLFADHVGSRRSTPSADASRLAGRLTELGLSPEAAGQQVSALTAGEIAFFSADPARVQVVGAAQDMFSGESDNLWYETIAGGGFLLFGLGI